MTIPTLPTAPDPNAPATFNARASAWVAALDAWTVAVNALPAVTSTFEFLDGSPSGPSMTFSSDDDTGFYLFAANTIGVAANGTEAMRISNVNLFSAIAPRFLAPSDLWTSTGTVYSVGTQASPLGQMDSYSGNAVTITSNGYRDNTAGTNLWQSYGIGGTTGAAQMACDPTGFVSLRAQTTKADGAAFTVTEVLRAYGGGQVGVVDGAVGGPGYSFISDLDTGVQRPAANTLALVTGGVEAWRISSAGGLYAGSANAMATVGACAINIQGTTTATSSIAMMRASNDANTAILNFVKTRGTAVDDYAIVTVGDPIGRINYRGGDGAGAAVLGATFIAVAETAAANDVRMGLRFSTGSASGGTTSEALRLTTTQAVLAVGVSGGIGYLTGASIGGTVTQITSRTTGVTLNKLTGEITLFSAAGSATPASFTVTNSTMTAVDTVDINQKSGTNKYFMSITAKAAGSFEVTFYTTGVATDAPVFGFTIIRSANS